MRGAKLVGLYRIQIRGLPAAFSLVIDRTILERPLLCIKRRRSDKLGVKTTHAQRKKGQKRAGRRTCTKNKGTEKSRPQLFEVQDKGLDQFFTSFTDFTRMASWTSGQS